MRTFLSLGVVAISSLTAVVTTAAPAPAGRMPAAPSSVPDSLRPWIPWVMHDHEQELCPNLVNDAGNDFVCAWGGRLELSLTPGGGRFSHAGAHENFLVFRRGRGELERVQTPGTWLALVADVTACTRDSTVTLEPGDTMVLFTDGITETANPAGDMFELTGLEDALRELGDLSVQPVDEILRHVFSKVQAWSSLQDDDRTAVVVRYLGQDA